MWSIARNRIYHFYAFPCTFMIICMWHQYDSMFDDVLDKNYIYICLYIRDNVMSCLIDSTGIENDYDAQDMSMSPKYTDVANQAIRYP